LSQARRITPSPTFDRAENLARLKDTTAKLSRGVTPPPPLPNQIPEKKSEIVESPPSFHRQIKIESQVGEVSLIFETQMLSGQNDPDPGEESDVSERSVECEAENKNKEKDEVPRKLYIRKELIPLTERLHNDTESTDCDKEKANILEEEMPTFDIQAIKNVFELGEQSSLFREEKKDQEELVSCLSETTGGSRQSTPLPPQKDELETVPAKPSAFSEAKSITEHFSDVDEFGNKVTGTRTAITEHSESVSTHQTPFSYADAVKRKAAAAVRRTQTYDEDATENLLRNFHKTWTESETVFKSLGYTVSEETTSQVVSHQTKIVSSGKNCSESLSDGCSDSGQKKVP
uniref:Xin actin binding repeat containing 2 n=1 Tax=Stegastes partitus TaxID=144197 RepID=A0A3B4ZXM3_9TELE